MDTSKLLRVTKVVVHANCPDGTASAIILKEALGLAPEQIVFTELSSPEHDNLPAEPGMLFCDCTPPHTRVQEFVDAGALVLDHHKHSREIVAAFGENGVFADKETQPTVSGARLAYLEVWWPMRHTFSSSTLVEDFVSNFSLLAGVRDNWQQDNPLWSVACECSAVLFFYPTEYWMNEDLSSLVQEWDAKYMPLGKILVQKDQERAAGIAEKRWTYRITSGLVIAIVNSRFVSDVADLLEDQCDVLIGFAYTKNEPGCYPGLLLSLRSYGDSFDCGKFCKSYGGGGHLNAAGCKFETVERTLNPFKLICDKVEEYLNCPEMTTQS